MAIMMDQGALGDTDAVNRIDRSAPGVISDCLGEAE